MAFVGSRLLEHSFAGRIPAPFDQVAVQSLVHAGRGAARRGGAGYTRTRDLIVPLTVITPVLVGFAGARVLLWPDSLPVRVAVEVGYRLILLTASMHCSAAPRRWEPSAWLLALSLPTLHLVWGPLPTECQLRRLWRGSCTRALDVAGRSRSGAYAREKARP